MRFSSKRGLWWRSLRNGKRAACRFSVTFIAARISKSLAFIRNKLPVVALRMQREFEHAECISLVSFAVFDDARKDAMCVLAPCTNDELANSVLRISFAVWILLSKALIVVVVAANDNVRAVVVKNVPERLDLNVIAMC